MDNLNFLGYIEGKLSLNISLLKNEVSDFVYNQLDAAQKEYPNFYEFEKTMELLLGENYHKYSFELKKALKVFGNITSIGITPDYRIDRLMFPFNREILQVTIGKIERKRSDKQNRYLHGVVYPIIIEWAAETTGIHYTIEEVKEFVYRYVLNERLIEKQVFGKSIVIPEKPIKRFSEMTTKEFEENVAFIRNYFAEKDCYIPEPHTDKKQTGYIADYYKPLKDE